MDSLEKQASDLLVSRGIDPETGLPEGEVSPGVQMIGFEDLRGLRLISTIGGGIRIQPCEKPRCRCRGDEFPPNIATTIEHALEGE